VALAARMLPMADGSDMMGSLRNPAGWCNVIGFRPSWGRVPNAAPEGDLYYHQISTDGPMARSVADLALLLDAQAGFDPAAPLSHGRPGVFAEALETPDPRPWARGLRIGWIGDWDGRWPMEPGILETTRAALGALERLGAEVVPVTPDFDWDLVWQSWRDLRAWANVGRLLPDYEDDNRRAHLKPEAIWEIETGLALSALDIHRAGAIRADWHRCLERLMGEFDLLAMPTAQVWPFDAQARWPGEIAGRKMDAYHRWMECVVPGSLSGRPTVAVPAGLGAPGSPGEGLPIGVQLMGRTRGDLEVLKAAAAYEAEADWVAARPPEPA
jgi:amidase